MVRGTKMMRDTSLVTNMLEKNTPNTRKKLSPNMVENFSVSRRTGRNRFSCLKPSSTLSSINRVARVFQSMAFTRSALGGVITSDTSAAATLTTSIASFFRKEMTVFIESSF